MKSNLAIVSLTLAFAVSSFAAPAPSATLPGSSESAHGRSSGTSKVSPAPAVCDAAGTAGAGVGLCARTLRLMTLPLEANHKTLLQGGTPCSYCERGGVARRKG
jgi:hypothetical protein